MKIEFYPDGFDAKGDAKGPKTMVLNFFIPNGKRFKALTKSEKDDAWELIERFKGRLHEIQKEIIPEI